MLIMEIFVTAKKCQSVLLTTYAREPMLEKSWRAIKPGLEKVLRCQFCQVEEIIASAVACLC